MACFLGPSKTDHHKPRAFIGETTAPRIWASDYLGERCWKTPVNRLNAARWSSELSATEMVPCVLLKRAGKRIRPKWVSLPLARTNHRDKIQAMGTRSWISSYLCRSNLCLSKQCAACWLGLIGKLWQATSIDRSGLRRGGCVSSNVSQHRSPGSSRRCFRCGW